MTRAVTMLFVIAVLGVTAVVGLGGTFVPATASDAPSSRTAPTAAPVSHAVTAKLVSLTPNVVRPGKKVTATVSFRNTSGKTIQHPRATLTLSRYRISSRTVLDSWTSASPTADAGDLVDVVTDAKPLREGKTWKVTLHIDAADIRLSDAASAWGPRGVAASLTDGVDAIQYPADRLSVLRSFILWYPVGSDGEIAPGQKVEPLHLAVTVPLVGPPLDPSSTTESDSAVDAATSSGSRLADVVAATQDQDGVTWAADPAFVALASRSDSDTTTAWARLVCRGAADHDTYALPAFDADIAAYAHAEEPIPGTPKAVTTANCSGSSTARSQADGTNLATAWKHGLALPASAVPDEQTLATAYRSGDRLAIARAGDDGPFASTAALDYTLDASDPTKVGGNTMNVLVADDQLSTLVANADGSSPGAEQDLLAQTAVIARQSDGGAHLSADVLASMPRSWDPNASTWDANMTTLSSAPWVRLTSLTSVASQSPAADSNRNSPRALTRSGAELSPASIDALARARSGIHRFSAVANDPSAVLAESEPPLLAPASVAYRSDTGARTRATDAAIASTGATTRSVTVVPGSTVNLISSAGELPVTVRNHFDQPVTVTVVLHSSDPKLVVKSLPSLTIPANDEGTTKVAVGTLGNGDVSAYVELHSSDGASIASAPPFDVRVHADWDTVGTAVIAALLAIALLAGIWRTVRRGRSTARVTREQAPEAEVAGTSEAPPTGSTPIASAPTVQDDDGA